MKCKECTLWVQHVDKFKRPLDKGHCLNRDFASRHQSKPLITGPDVRCSKGDKK